MTQTEKHSAGNREVTSFGGLTDPFPLCVYDRWGLFDPVHFLALLL